MIDELIAEAKQYIKIASEATESPWEAKANRCKCGQCPYGSVWTEEDGERFTVAREVHYYWDAKLIESAPKMAKLLEQFVKTMEDNKHGTP